MLSVFAVVVLFSPAVQSQALHDLTADDYGRAEDMLRARTSKLIFRASVRPTWIDGSRLWYRNTVPGGTEFILVDGTAGTRERAFDHARLAQTLSTGEASYDALSLPFSQFSYTDDGNGITFQVQSDVYTCTLSAYECTSVQTDRRPPGSFNPFARSATVDSPDGTKTVFIRDYNLWVRDLKTRNETQLTTDGVQDFGYATNNAGWTKSDGPVVLWSPDSRKVATFQHDGRGVGEMYMVSTASGHPELQQWKYPLPGDSLIFRISRVIIDVNDATMVRLNMPPDPHRSTTSDHIAGRGGLFLDVEWSDDATQLAFVSSSRDHKVAQLRVANVATGEVRDVLKEVSKTYFESGVRLSNWHFLPESNEVIWFSERDNWGHLYLYDLASGALKHQITKGDWAVLQLRWIDKENRKLYFMAGGKEPGDPYFQHFYSIRFDGSDLQLLTREDANHSVSMSPSHRFFIDSYSTPVDPPVTVLRDLTGRVVVELETADISELVASGWQPPTPVKVKARDGETDIYGLMYKPANFDSSRKYPVLNYLYPGPQTGSVGSRSFAASRSDKQAAAELGFIVVEVDAMGTPGRSKSFHDAYYGNMGDNGLPDQVAAIKQLGAENPWMDLDKVGIWGHSGGGFASTAGILRYPDFYKVAVSGAGNHDNATYEDDWGEKWQGLLLRNEDGTTSYDNQANYLLAGNLKGKLMIAHGTLDGNVPQNNTLLMVDALVKANKDFDLLMFPNQSHGFGTGRTYWMRRRWDYFVKNLLGVNPPREYEFGKREERVQIKAPTG